MSNIFNNSKYDNIGMNIEQREQRDKGQRTRTQSDQDYYTRKKIKNIMKDLNILDTSILEFYNDDELDRLSYFNKLACKVILKAKDKNILANNELVKCGIYQEETAKIILTQLNKFINFKCARMEREQKEELSEMIQDYFYTSLSDYNFNEFKSGVDNLIYTYKRDNNLSFNVEVETMENIAFINLHELDNSTNNQLFPNGLNKAIYNELLGELIEELVITRKEQEEQTKRKYIRMIKGYLLSNKKVTHLSENQIKELAILLFENEEIQKMYRDMEK